MNMSGSLFKNIPVDMPEEIFETLSSGNGMRIERIISDGHVSPPDFWYDQEWNEWVVLLSGSAVLRFDDDQIVSMHPGDWVDIPRHQRHRVDWTAPKTVWLAVHYN